MSRVFQLKDKLPQIGGFYPLRCGSRTRQRRNFSTAFAAEHPGVKADIMIHAIGFAPRSCFDRPILFVEDQDINTAMTISANSLQRCLKFAMPYLSAGSSTITLTYAASTRFVHHYGIMSMAKAALECWTRELACHLGPEGISVNSISSGPIRTIAASGFLVLIKFLITSRQMLLCAETSAKLMLQGTTLWLQALLPAGVTGQCIHVDGGYSITMVPQSIMDV